MITRVQKVERRNEPPPAARLVNIKLTNCQPNQPLLGHQVEPAASRQARCPHARLDCCEAMGQTKEHDEEIYRQIKLWIII